MTTDTTAIPQGARGAANPAVTASLLILLVATATIAGAWFFQLVLDIQPCPLCLEQRYAYYALIPLSALVAIGAARRARAACCYWCAARARGARQCRARHLPCWRRMGFLEGADSTGPVGNLGSAGSLLERLDTVKVVRCDEVQWRFLGISLAGYNVLISLSMAAIAAWGLIKASTSKSSW